MPLSWSEPLRWRPFFAAEGVTKKFRGSWAATTTVASNKRMLIDRVFDSGNFDVEWARFARLVASLMMPGRFEGDEETDR